VVSVLLLIGSFALFEYEEQCGVPIDEARTVAVNLFVAVEVLYLFSCRSLTVRARDLGMFSSRWLIAGVAAMVRLMAHPTERPVPEVPHDDERLFAVVVATATAGNGS
jgi:cation-transporting ATPase F